MTDSVQVYSVDVISNGTTTVELVISDPRTGATIVVPSDQIANFRRAVECADDHDRTNRQAD